MPRTITSTLGCHKGRDINPKTIQVKDMDGWEEGWKGWWVGGWMDGWTDGRTDGETDRQVGK